MKANNKLLTILYGFKYKDKFSLFNGGFDPEYYKFSPEFILMLESIRLAKEEGIKEFDFLSGDREYKRRLRNSSEKLYSLLITRKNLKTSLFHAFQNAVKTLRPKIHRRVFILNITKKILNKHYYEIKKIFK